MDSFNILQVTKTIKYEFNVEQYVGFYKGWRTTHQAEVVHRYGAFFCRISRVVVCRTGASSRGGDAALYWQNTLALFIRAGVPSRGGIQKYDAIFYLLSRTR